MSTVSVARIAAAGIVTLLFSLVVAPAASAYERADAVVLANNMIERCVKEGGEPDGIGSENTITVYCKMPEGQPAGDLCDFWPGPPKCYLLPNLGDARGELPTDGGALNGGDATLPSGTTRTPESAHGSRSVRSAKQDDEKHGGQKLRKHKGNDRRHGKR